jgi:hypothetical protein
MKTSYGSRERACLRKQKYDTHEEAMRAGARHGNTVYRCLFCSLYHLTSGTQKKINKRQRKRAKALDPITNFKRYGAISND